MVKKASWIVLFCMVSVAGWSQSRELECRNQLKEGRNALSQFRAIEAMQHYQHALRLAKAIDNPYLIAMGLMGCSQATWYAGNFQNAADTMRLTLQYFTPADVADKIGALRILSNIYDDIGDYVNAFKSVQEAIALNQGIDRQNRLLSMVQMGKLYKNIGDYDMAMDYYTKVLERWPTPGSYPYRELYHCMGDLYVAMDKFDSAYYFYRQAFTGFPTSPVIRLKLGELHLLQQHTDSAAFYFDTLYKEAITKNDVNIGIGVTIGLGKIARSRGDMPTALSLAQAAFDKAMERGIYLHRMQAANLLGNLYQDKGDAEKALRYLQLYHRLKDSTLSDMYRGQLFSFKQKTQQAEQTAVLAALEADKKLAQRTILIVALLSVLVIAFIAFRHKNEKLRLKQQTAEMEMQALLAQMNPHFIFNCLSAINHCILNKEPDKASEYLTRFSRLMRMVLVNAHKKAISLEEELDMLKLYLTMEQLRFKDAFDYTIDVQAGLHPAMIQVPCFIIQPFCENAIWHGLLHKDGKGHLRIAIRAEGQQLVIAVQDDGVGLEEAARRKTKNNESMGMHMTATRLAIYNQGSRIGPHFALHDIKDSNGQTAGTEALIRINTPIAYD